MQKYKIILTFAPKLKANMNYLRHLATKYPVTFTLNIIIWILCLTPIFPSTPLNHYSLADKWTHIAMYAGTFGIMWIEYIRKNDTINRKKLLWLGIVAPILMGGLIELLQAYCTGGRRSGEWLDFVADAIGVILATIFGILLVSYRAKARKDS